MVAPLALIVALITLLWPAHAWAWGPLAHLEFSSTALQTLSAVSPGLRLLLAHYSGEFLYGSLAADIIVGKNLARYAVHCHNWNVGFQVLDRSKTDGQRAFSMGFLAHLAADTVAHNYYVPYKTVQSFRRRASGHAYWELRFDQRLSPDLWRMARRVSHEAFREHDEHLEECLANSFVIPFGVSKRLFGSLLVAARLKKWQRMSEMLASERTLTLGDDEIRDCTSLAVGQILGMLQNGTSAECTRADPTGERNLSVAKEVRGRLRADHHVTAAVADDFILRARPAFRAAIHGRLRLPELPS